MSAASRSNETDRAGAATVAALQPVLEAKPFLIDVQRAGSVLPELSRLDVLHAGPPLEGWHEACPTLRASIVGTLLIKGLTNDAKDAERMAAETLRLRSAGDLNALGTFANVIIADTLVFVVENRTTGTRAYTCINEGRGRALRYGSHERETLDRLAWLEGEFAEILGTAIRNSGGIDLFAILEQALHMGDEGHSRQKASSALLVGILAPWLLESGHGAKAVSKVLGFLAANDFFFLPLAMAAAKSALASVPAIPGSALLTAMAFNGARGGIQVSATGRRWFTAPIPALRGGYFSSYSEADAGPVIGDSEIVETLGLGAFAMAGAPSLARYVGGSVEEATRLTQEMYRITVAEHPRFTIPALSYRGAPCGVDVRKVLASGVAPAFSSGIAHRTPGVGQIGAGLGRMPMACFEQAAAAIAGNH